MTTFALSLSITLLKKGVGVFKTGLIFYCDPINATKRWKRAQQEVQSASFKS